MCGRQKKICLSSRKIKIFFIFTSVNFRLIQIYSSFYWRIGNLTLYCKTRCMQILKDEIVISLRWLNYFDVSVLPALGVLLITSKKASIWPEIPEDALLTRQQVVAILHIGMSTLDSLIPDSELPRVRLSKRVFVLKKDLEAYILAHRSTIDDRKRVKSEAATAGSDSVIKSSNIPVGGAAWI